MRILLNIFAGTSFVYETCLRIRSFRDKIKWPAGNRWFVLFAFPAKIQAIQENQMDPMFSVRFE